MSCAGSASASSALESAGLCEDDANLKQAVFLHRVEKNNAATVLYSASELAEAAAAGIEMRGVKG